MESQAVSPQELIRQAVIEVVNLPEADLLLVIHFVRSLKEQQVDSSSVSDIRAEARRLAFDMANLPRAEVQTRFRAIAERIRAQAIARGTAIAEDWEGD
jgi:hypothetical protein